MKVKELIQILQEMEPENQVFVEENNLIYSLNKRYIRQKVVDNIPGVYFDLRERVLK